MYPLRQPSHFTPQPAAATNHAARPGEVQIRHAYPTALSLSNLSINALELLSDLKKTGDKPQRLLASLTLNGVTDGAMTLDADNRPGATSASYAQRIGNDTKHQLLLLEVKQNSLSEFDVVSVSLRSPAGDEETYSFTPHHDKETPVTSLQRLPVELQQSIMEQTLASGERGQGVYSLNALKNSSRTLHAAYFGHTLLRQKQEQHTMLFGAINAISTDHLTLFADSILFTLASEKKREACLQIAIESLDEDAVNAMGSVMDKLKPEQRHRLVMAILGFDFEGPNSDSMKIVYHNLEKGNMLGSLGAALHTVPDHHAAIVDAILQLQEVGQAWAIHGLGKGLHALDSESVDKLVQAALAIKDEGYKTPALEGLSKVLPALSEPQRDAVFDTALTIKDELTFSFDVLGGLCKGLTALKPEQQMALAEAVSAMTDENHKARAMTKLGAKLTALPFSQAVDILQKFTTCISTFHSESAKSKAFYTLGEGLPVIGQQPNSETTTYRQVLQQLTTIALTMAEDRDKSDAIAGLGAGLQALTSAQRESLTGATLAIAEDIFKSVAIAGLGKGLQALTAEQRDRLVTASLSMSDDINRGHAIIGLAAGLHTLTAEQRGRLVTASVAVVDEEDRSNVISGLGGALQVLTSEEHARLTDAALSIKNDAYKSRAIWGLGGMTDSLQYRRLVEAAIRLPSFDSQGMDTHRLETLEALSTRYA